MGPISDSLKIVLYCLFVTAVSASKEEKLLLKRLLVKSSPYNRPVLHHTQVVNVTLRVSIDQIIDLDPSNGNMTIAGSYILKWGVPMMSWVPDDHGNVTSLHVPPDRIWTPDLSLKVKPYLGEKKNRRLQSKVGRDLFGSLPILIYPKGQAEWRCPTTTVAFCHAEVIDFPFDRHLCLLNFTLWSHPNRLASLSPERPIPLELTSAYDGIWKPYLLPVTKDVYIIDHEAHDQLVVGFYLQRSPSFYIFHVLYPIVILMPVSLLSFFIPNREGKKMAFSVSVMTSMYMFSKLILNQGMAAGFYIPFIGQLFGMGVTLTALAVIFGVATMRLNFSGKRRLHNQLPSVTLLRFLGRITCMRNKVEELLERLGMVTENIGNDSVTDREDGQTSYTFRNKKYADAVTAITRTHDNYRAINRNGTKTSDVIRRSTRKSFFSEQHFELELIASEVRDLKEKYFTVLETKRVDDNATESWAVVANMFQRVMLVLTCLALVGATTGVVCLLALRPHPEATLKYHDHCSVQ